MVSSVVFSVTHDCPISCKYCVTRSGPRGGPFLDAKFMKEAIGVLDDYFKLSLVVFTGGEALIHKREVEKTLRFATSRGIWSRIVTNAFWAKSPGLARRTLLQLKDAGLCEINISCDDLHQEHIPLENIYNAFWAAKNVGVPLLLAHKEVAHGKITRKSLGKFLGVRLKVYKEGKTKPSEQDLISSSLTVPVGNGVEWLPEDDYIIYPDNPSAWTAPCSGIFDSLVISPGKDIRICCGMMEQTVPELTVGKWDRDTILEILYRANTDLIANWLALEGPYGLMKFIREKKPAVKFRGKYVNHCHLCNDILTNPDARAVLKQYAGERSSAISFRRGLLEAIRYVDDKPGNVTSA